MRPVPDQVSFDSEEGFAEREGDFNSDSDQHCELEQERPVFVQILLDPALFSRRNWTQSGHLGPHILDG